MRPQASRSTFTPGVTILPYTQLLFVPSAPLLALRFTFLRLAKIGRLDLCGEVVMW
jgi:hypothetical protein